ncbi:MAG: SHOCT domain-containing protein [Candidatus Bathyarchaeota archaeon]|nr:SHOCT domain-containing protein [Candidatus Bathyarchaeum sp.]
MWFGWGFMMWGPICMILVAVGIYYVVTSSRHSSCLAHVSTSQTQQYSGKAIELLKERYAKGEITKEQFQEMKKELQ